MLNPKSRIPFVAAFVVYHFVIAISVAAPVIYNNEAKFLADIGALGGYEFYSEDFEAPAWGHVRSPEVFDRHSAVSVTNLGLTWSGRTNDLITTNHNWARGVNQSCTTTSVFFALPGSAQCGEGSRGSSPHPCSR